jgi:hypothetical protein
MFASIMRNFQAYFLLFVMLGAGCAGPLTGNYLSDARKPDVETPAKQTATPSERPASAAVRKATAEPLTEEEALASVLDELQEIRAIDPEAERELMADLRDAKPEHYPMIVDTFSTALAYRQQLAKRQTRPSDADTLLAVDSPPAAESARLPGFEREGASRAAAVRASLVSARTAHSQPQSEPRPAPVEPTAAPMSPDRPAPPQVEPSAVPSAPTARALYPSEQQQPPGANAQSVIAADNPRNDVQPASHAAPLEPVEWHRQLDWTINALASSVSPQPASTAELHDHMRLRTLQLIAGREEEAYRPIPGASPAQQDYWSKQLFAMAAYLDAAQKLDDKQRAAAALVPFDEARAKLSELATLQIRNAAFVAKVDGYGSYEPQKSASFQPGKKITLYAEVENFTSNAAEDGFHTSLGTSYQVLDSTGRRVDAKQFPDVSDKCRNRRRDFHMQYELALPTRIYPGEYELELTITDHNSGKIGQSRLPFQIAGEQ